MRNEAVRHLTRDEVLAIHARLIEVFGGPDGVRDRGLLESALFRPRTGYYDDVAAMAAWLGVDSLAYLSVGGMMEAAEQAAETQGFCSACFSRVYPVPVERGVVFVQTHRTEFRGPRGGCRTMRGGDP